VHTQPFLKTRTPANCCPQKKLKRVYVCVCAPVSMQPFYWNKDTHFLLYTEIAETCMCVCLCVHAALLLEQGHPREILVTPPDLPFRQGPPRVHRAAQRGERALVVWAWVWVCTRVCMCVGVCVRMVSTCSLSVCGVDSRRGLGWWVHVGVYRYALAIVVWGVCGVDSRSGLGWWVRV